MIETVEQCIPCAHVDKVIVVSKDLNDFVGFNNYLFIYYCQKFICSYCLHGCKTKDILDRHVERCKLHSAQREAT